MDMLSLIPRLIFPSADQIPVTMLKENGIQLLMLDFDNTIVPYTTSVPTPEMLAWLKVAAQEIPLCVVSNSRRPRVQEFCKKYQIPCITRAKKPGGKGIRQALEQFHCAPCHAALVGDQIYTDVLGANCAGVTSVLITPIQLHSWPLKLRHVLEQPFIRLGRRRCHV